jgi:signal peptidase I
MSRDILIWGGANVELLMHVPKYLDIDEGRYVTTSSIIVDMSYGTLLIISRDLDKIYTDNNEKRKRNFKIDAVIAIAPLSSEEECEKNNISVEEYVHAYTQTVTSEEYLYDRESKNPTLSTKMMNTFIFEDLTAVFVIKRNYVFIHSDLSDSEFKDIFECEKPTRGDILSIKNQYDGYLITSYEHYNERLGFNLAHYDDLNDDEYYKQEIGKRLPLIYYRKTYSRRINTVKKWIKDEQNLDNDQNDDIIKGKRMNHLMYS